jgi:hypothetical protein
MWKLELTASGIKFIILLAILLLLSSVHGEEQYHQSAKKVGILPVPALGYAPETGLYFGVVSLLTFKLYPDSTTRTSSGKLELNITTKKQVIFESGWNYFFNEEKWFSRGLVHLSKYPDLYYGIGENTPESNEVNFRSNRAIFEFELLKSIAKKTFIGPLIRYTEYRKIEYIDGSQNIFDALTAAHIFGLGLTMIRDNRSNILNPRHGSYGEIAFVSNYLNDHWYHKFKLDLRKYVTINDHTLSFRLLQESLSGAPPFYDYILFGGDKNARGYYYGRFRDKNLTTLQGEYRSPVWWRFGLAAFGGVSKVYPVIDTFSASHLKPNYGLGLRLLTDRKEQINLRLDYAAGADGQDGFYVYFGESF